MICTKCTIDKPRSEFYKAIDRASGTLRQCKTCRCAAIRKWQAKHPRGRTARRDRKRKELKAWILAYLQLHPCVDCGENDPIVLEFDHVRGKKELDICAMVQNRRSLPAVIAEVEKCDVRCANCHRRQTVKRRQSHCGAEKEIWEQEKR